MSSDDQKTDGRSKQPTRGSNGRWLPRRCPNPKGRPRKKPRPVENQADVRVFGNTRIEVFANGRMETMDRREALLFKMFESAMKGNVMMQNSYTRSLSRTTCGWRALAAELPKSAPARPAGLRIDRKRQPGPISGSIFDFMNPGIHRRSYRLA